MDEDFEKGTGPRKFSFDELALATSNFAEEILAGGFGGVCRGFLRELNSHVAVKRVSRGGVGEIEMMERSGKRKMEVGAVWGAARTGQQAGF
uniref:Uncharacterized protein n=1 Tax=Vitis vinifera TaxID=29760 RepID=F6HBL5_VITVI